MKKFLWVIDVGLLILTVLLINATSLGNVVFYHHPGAALFEGIQNGEDELRYLAKIKEASEGHWLMGNPFLKEHRDDFFSPSGFVEWLPAEIIRILNGDMGLMMLITNILMSAITIVLTWAWLKRLIKDPWIVWSTMFLLFFSHFGGSLEALLRDTAPKYVQPFASLYLLLLTFPGRNTLRQTMMRGALIGCMFYTYPYHWTLFLVTEGVFLLYKTWIFSRSSKPAARSFFFLVKNGLATFAPFIIIAGPMALAMRRVLSRPEFSDFYDRYHIVFTHIPAAPSLQLEILGSIAILCGTAWYLKKYKKIKTSQTMNDLLPLLLPLIGMMILLWADVITGQDPELLGHGGRVIISIVTVAYAVMIARVIPVSLIKIVAAIFLIFFVGFMSEKAVMHVQTLNADEQAWDVSPELDVLKWLNTHLPPEQIIAAPRVLSEKIPVYTTHYTEFAAGAHFFFVSMDELTDRYLAWVGLFPKEKELTSTATVILFGSHPGGQWSKDRTIAKLMGQPFTKTMADYIGRQDLRREIDTEYAHPDYAKKAERLMKYHTDVIVLDANSHWIPSLMNGFTKATMIGPYTVWVRKGVTVTP